MFLEQQLGGLFCPYEPESRFQLDFKYTWKVFLKEHNLRAAAAESATRMAHVAHQVFLQDQVFLPEH